MLSPISCASSTLQQFGTMSSSRVRPAATCRSMQPEMYRVAVMVGVLTLLILAVACANVGGLLLARGITREHEISIRVAIGASRSRIFRQLCTESFILAGLGALTGIGLGCSVLHVALARLDAPEWLTATPDWRVVLFTIGVMFMSALFFGLAPALQIARQRQRRTTLRQVSARRAGSGKLCVAHRVRTSCASDATCSLQ